MSARTPTTTPVIENVANALKPFGGVLRCSRCGIERNVGDISLHLMRDGWPTHCGYTMTWVTDRQLEAEHDGQ